MFPSITTNWLRRPLIAAAVLAAGVVAVAGSATQAQAQYYPYYANNPYYYGYCDPYYNPYACAYPGYANGYGYPYYGYAAPVAAGLGFGWGWGHGYHGGRGGFHGGRGGGRGGGHGGGGHRH